MKTRLLLILMSFAACFVSAGTLEWLTYWNADDAVAFDTVVIGRVTDKNASPLQNGLYIGYTNAEGFWQTDPVSYGTSYDPDFGYYAMGETVISDFSSVQNAYYYFELLSGDDVVGYSDLLDYKTVDWSVDNPGNYLAVSTFHSAAVPEPSSGLLLLMGGALLGLRRKRRLA